MRHDPAHQRRTDRLLGMFWLSLKYARRELRGGFKEEAVLDSFFSGTRENTNSPFACLVPFVVLTAKSNPRLSGDRRATKREGEKSSVAAA